LANELWSITMSEQRYKNRTYRNWQEEELLWLQKMHQAGLSVRDIAYTLKRSTYSVYTQVSRLKLNMNTPLEDSDISAHDLAAMMAVHRTQIENYIAHGLNGYIRGAKRYFTIQQIKDWLIGGMADIQWDRRDLLDPRFIRLVDECRQKSSKWLVNRREVVSAFGVVNQTITNWLRLNEFPKPSIIKYPNQQIWNKQEVETWAWKNGRVIKWTDGA
jgi:predicted DNA-binding transcriptional regulator AlpA